MSIYFRIYADANDGYVSSTSTGAIASGVSDSAGTTLTGGYNGATGARVHEAFLAFDTSAVATPAAATLTIDQVVRANTAASGSSLAYLKYYNWGTTVTTAAWRTASQWTALTTAGFNNALPMNDTPATYQIPFSNFTGWNNGSTQTRIAFARDTIVLSGGGWTFASADTSGTTSDPYITGAATGAWSFVGVGTVVEGTSTSLTLTEPAGVADGDLLVACFASRTTATTAVTNTGWTEVNSQNNNNTSATAGSAIGSGTMLYQVRAGTPDLIFVVPAGISVIRGQIVAYRGNATTTPLDVSTAGTTATGISAVSVAGLTTTQDDDLIVAMAAGGQEATWSGFTNVTTPLTASGATDTTTAPSATAWTERAESITTTGADTSIGIFDAVRTTTGATGNLTVTASIASGHVVIAGAFKIAPPPTADAWNVNDKSANFTLSASDKTALISSAVSSGVRSTTTHTNGTAGKYYAEFVVGGSDVPLRFGIAPTSNTLVDALNNFVITPRNGNIFINNTTVGSIGTAAIVGDVLCVAWDAGAELVWFRKNGGNWNNTAGHNPATGTSGFDCSFAASTDHALWMQDTGVVGRGGTIRTELAEFTQAVPAGFNSWMGEASGPTAYTLPAVAGTHTLTGQTASLEKSRFITADAGSYVLTGADATLTKGVAAIAYNLPADAGAYALTGATAGLYRGLEVLAVAGSYGLSGATASLERGYEVAADPGSYALTGTVASLELGKEVLAIAGTYAVTGTAATLRYDRKPVAVPGSYALSGATSSLEYGREVTTNAGSFALTGTAAALLHTWKATAVSGSYTLTGTPANLLKPGSYAIIGLPGAYNLTGTVTSLEAGREVLADAGSYALTGADVSLEKGREAAADAGSYALTGAPTSLEIGREALAVAGSYALTGAAATLRRTWKTPAVAGSYALSGQVATFQRAWEVLAVSGSYTLSGLPANLLTVGARAIIGLPGSYGLTGAIVSLEVGREALALAGSYALTGTATSLEKGREVLALAGSYALTGQPATLSKIGAGTVLIGAAGSYTLTGQPVTLVYSGEVAVTPPGGGMPWYGRPSGGYVSKKELRKAIRELLKREEKRKKRRKPKEIAREIIAAIEPQGLGVAEKRIAVRLIGEALRSQLPSLFYSQPIIRDKEQIARAILFLVSQAMQRIADEEEDEEAALLLLSAA